MLNQVSSINVAYFDLWNYNNSLHASASILSDLNIARSQFTLVSCDIHSVLPHLINDIFAKTALTSAGLACEIDMFTGKSDSISCLSKASRFLERPRAESVRGVL